MLCAVVGGAMLARCGGGGTTGSPVVLHTDPPIQFTCSALAINGPALVSPAAGSTGVPATLTVLTFGRIVGIPQSVSGNATLIGNDGSTIVSGPLTPSSDLSTTTASIAGLLPHTTYAVTVSGTVTGRGCTNSFSANDGSFTTQ